MITQCFNKLLIKKYHNYNIYIHNGSNFDLIFLLEYLLNRKKVQLTPLYSDGLIKRLTVNYCILNENKKDDYCTLRIMDSYLLLINSLSKLSNSN